MGIDPPYRLDPFQNIVNIKWKGDVHAFSYAYFVLAWQGDLDWHIHATYVVSELDTDGLADNDHFLDQMSPIPPNLYAYLVDELVVHNWTWEHTNLSYYFPEVLDYYNTWINEIWPVQGVYPLPTYRVWFEEKPTA